MVFAYPFRVCSVNIDVSNIAPAQTLRHFIHVFAFNSIPEVLLALLKHRLSKYCIAQHNIIFVSEIDRQIDDKIR